MLLRGIKKREPAEIEQAGPALAVAADDVGDRDLFIRIRAKITFENPQSIGRLNADGLSQSSRREDAYHRGGMTAAASRPLLQVVDRVVKGSLYRRQEIIGFADCVDLHFDVAGHLRGDLILAKGKSC